MLRACSFFLYVLLSPPLDYRRAAGILHLLHAPCCCPVSCMHAACRGPATASMWHSIILYSLLLLLLVLSTQQQSEQERRRLTGFQGCIPGLFFLVFSGTSWDAGCMGMGRGACRPPSPALSGVLAIQALCSSLTLGTVQSSVGVLLRGPCCFLPH